MNPTLNILTYLRKPFFVQAVQVTDSNMEDVAEWCGGRISTKKSLNSESIPYIKVKVHRALSRRQTEAYVGDWVLRAGSGFKVYTDKAFGENFDLAPADVDG